MKSPHQIRDGVDVVKFVQREVKFTFRMEKKLMEGNTSNLKAVKQILDDGENTIESCFGPCETKILGSDSGRNEVFLLASINHS